MHALQDELGQMMKTFEANHRSLSDYDGIYFVGEHAASFPLRASQIANGLKNFRGVIVNSLSHEKRLRISNQINNAGFWSFVSLNEIVKSSQKDKFLVVDFNDTLAGVQFRNFLSSSGIDALDYLRCMHDLDLVHTYLPVSEERQIILDSLPSYVNLVQELADPLSRNTVIARLKTYISLDRTHLHRVSQPFGLFTKHSQSHCALVINDKEEFVDAGAAHGDTVAEFYNACNGGYKSIHAFEPDHVNYKSLSSLCKLLPNTFCYHAGLSNRTENIDFYEVPNNRFGSNFASHVVGTVANKMGVIRLDEAVESASIIKIDVEGYETRVIEGAKNLIEKTAPAMNISGYHYPKDLLQILETVGAVHAYKHVAVRHFGSTLWDTNILFSDRQSFS